MFERKLSICSWVRIISTIAVFVCQTLAHVLGKGKGYVEYKEDEHVD